MRTHVRDNVAATAPIGMYAVAQHMIDHRLPAPMSITGPTQCTGENAILVGVFSHQVDAWVETIEIDVTTVTPTLNVTGYERVAYDGRLPDTGIRISVRCARRTVSHLRAVGA